MVTPRVTRALNPHKKRRLSLAQIRAGFGGKRRRNTLKASKRHKHKRRAKAANPKRRRRTVAAKAPRKRRRRAVTANPRKRRRKARAKANPRTRVVYRTRTKKVYVSAPRKRRRKANAKHRRKRSNPGPYLLTMSPVGNPHRKRRKSVAKHRRRASAKGRSGKRNPTRRRRVERRRTRHVRHSSRNPIGLSSSAVKGIIGAAVGFSIGKKVPPLFGPSMNSSPMMSLLSTAITAAAVAWAARKFAPAYAEGALIGGGMAVVNVAWNAWAPASIAGYSGLGDFVMGGFPLPQGPVRYPMALPAQAPNGSQVDIGAFGTAFTRAW